MTEDQRHLETARNLSEWSEKRRLYDELTYRPIIDTVADHTKELASLRACVRFHEEDIVKLQKALKRKDDAVKQVQAWMREYNDRVPVGFWQRLQWLFFGKRW